MQAHMVEIMGGSIRDLPESVGRSVGVLVQIEDGRSKSQVVSQLRIFGTHREGVCPYWLPER